MVAINIMDLETSLSGCIDSMTVYDGSTTTANRLHTLCNTAPDPFESAGNYVTLVFTSSQWTAGLGFQITWAAFSECSFLM